MKINIVSRRSAVVAMVGALMMMMIAMTSSSVDGFVTRTQVTTAARTSSNIVNNKPSSTSSSTSLSERKWNFNEGQGPWGLKKNAETWNGRVAQMAFVWVFLQELVAGKGVIKGIDEGDPFFIANAALFGLSLVALTGWLAIKGEDDYTKV
mmetsp:Transcript_23387/g.55434  ORF Transcript_23387/g.55434 Transcript_23387/m.55434 type:complete len:151 (-) Transcript_23387:176-628(-)